MTTGVALKTISGCWTRPPPQDRGPQRRRDIHDNRFTPIDLGGGKMLYEATASGAAIRRLITVPSECRNFGMLEISGAQLVVSLFSFGAPSNGGPVRINRNTWQPLP